MKKVVCEKCGTTFGSATHSASCPTCGTPAFSTREPSQHEAVSAAPPGIAWDHFDTIGIGNAFWKTLREILFSPKTFFSQFKPSDPIVPAILFALLLGSLQSVFSFLWAQVGVSQFSEAAAAISGDQLGPVSLLFAPLLTAVGLIMVTGYAHLLLVITRSRHQPFSSTFRAICYTQAAAVFTIVPSMGSIVSAIWGLVLLFSGLAAVHGVSRLRVVVVLFVPVFLLGLLTAGIIAAALIGGFFSSDFFRDFLTLYR